MAKKGMAFRPVLVRVLARSWQGHGEVAAATAGTSIGSAGKGARWLGRGGVHVSVLGRRWQWVRARGTGTTCLWWWLVGLLQEKGGAVS